MFLTDQMGYNYFLFMKKLYATLYYFTSCYIVICTWTESLPHSEKVLLNKKCFVRSNNNQLWKNSLTFLDKIG